MTYQLVSYNLCPYVQRAIIVLSEKGVKHDRTYIDLANKPDWFTAISPLGKVPVLKVDGTALFESAVICEYLDEVTEDSLHPADPLEKARHRSWIEVGSATLSAIGGFYSAPEATFEEKRQALQGHLARLETALGDGPYFAGDRFHMVDAVWPTVFRYFETFERIGDFGLTEGMPKVAAYRRAVMARPAVRNAVLPSYAEELMTFCLRRQSHLGDLARTGAGAAA
ncbi:glutathione S-transferase [Primorskyibacter flagellatus]|uniref:glutathione transferase n=1 Tax=Primorskyibacter flagellatus TaxID=1387277 RepID=A0A917EAL5_9RHOB|nr:glutathione S-transferase family protein [Primorskyibacter flagellatus]GGE15402.1 glutathione S-transferase [Primorskyibacter flagellatus]